MRTHGSIRRSLYDFADDRLAGSEASAVADHARRCPECAAEVEAIRSLIAVRAAAPVRPPSDALPEEYWSDFETRVMRRVEGGYAAHADRFRTLDWRIRRGVAIGAASAAVIVLGMLIVFLFSPPGDPPPGRGDAETAAAAADPSGRTGEMDDARETGFDRRLDAYFNRSKTLLVGVANLDPSTVTAGGIEAERLVSGDLIREGRILRGGPVDAGSYRLMEEIDRVLLGLAHGNGGPAPSLRAVREGIAERNLLFRLRMRETSSYLTPVYPASHVVWNE